MNKHYLPDFNITLVPSYKSNLTLWLNYKLSSTAAFKGHISTQDLFHEQHWKEFHTTYSSFTWPILHLDKLPALTAGHRQHLWSRNQTAAFTKHLAEHTNTSKVLQCGFRSMETNRPSKVTDANRFLITTCRYSTFYMFLKLSCNFIISKFCLDLLPWTTSINSKCNNCSAISFLTKNYTRETW